MPKTGTQSRCKALWTIAATTFGVALLLTGANARAEDGPTDSQIVGIVTAADQIASAAQPQHSGNAPASTITVIIRDFTFNPATVTVHTGDTVIWKNEDSVPHSATDDTDAQKPAFDSGAIQKGAAWQFIARNKGTYKYTCTFHPNMEGTLIVQ